MRRKRFTGRQALLLCLAYLLLMGIVGKLDCDSAALATQYQDDEMLAMYRAYDLPARYDLDREEIVVYTARTEGEQ